MSLLCFSHVLHGTATQTSSKVTPCSLPIGWSCFKETVTQAWHRRARVPDFSMGCVNNRWCMAAYTSPPIQVVPVLWGPPSLPPPPRATHTGLASAQCVWVASCRYSDFAATRCVCRRRITNPHLSYYYSAQCHGTIPKPHFSSMIWFYQPIFGLNATSFWKSPLLLSSWKEPPTVHHFLCPEGNITGRDHMKRTGNNNKKR